MNAALKLMRADGKPRSTGRRTIDAATRRNQRDVCKIQTFRSRNRIPGNPVELIDEAAAKLGDLREGVSFAAGILDKRRPANVDQHVARRVAPRMRILRCGKFG